MNLEKTAQFVNAVGALAVIKKGPIEDAPTMKEINEFIPGTDPPNFEEP